MEIWPMKETMQAVLVFLVLAAIATIAWYTNDDDSDLD
jgi:hypothetical protein